jgi:hypothetical protein
MQKNKLFNLLFVLLGIFLFGACEYATIQPDAPPPPPPPGDSTSFSLEVQPIFNNSCISCHAGSQKPDLRSGRSYQSLMDNNEVVKFNSAESHLYQILQPGATMNKWTNTTDIATIKYWIDEGAKNN